MQAAFSVCVFAVIGFASAQSAAGNETSTPQAGPSPDGQFGLPPMMDMSGAAAGISMLQGQKMQSEMMGNLLIEFQSALGWMQVAQGWLTMSGMEAKEAGADSMSMEQDMEKEVRELEEGPTPGTAGGEYDQTERGAEMTLLYVLKLMYFQAGNKLNSVHQSHYEMKMQFTMLNTMGAGQTGLGPILYMMYFRQILQTMSAGVTIQRQDSWNNWVLHEIMETDEFGNSRAGLPESFEKTMAMSRVVAMNTWNQEAMLDYQIMFLDFYMQMVMQQMMGVQTPQYSSFLQEEMTAEPADPAEPSKPAKPFVPFMGGPGAGGDSIMRLYLKFFKHTMHVQAAHGLSMHAHVDLMATMGNNADGDKLAKYNVMMKTHALFALQQWAYMYMIEIMMDVYMIFQMTTGGMIGPPAMHA